MGVVGRGRLGEATARLARGLGMTVLFARTPGQPCAPDERELDQLVREVDAISRRCVRDPVVHREHPAPAAQPSLDAERGRWVHRRRRRCGSCAHRLAASFLANAASSVRGPISRQTRFSSVNSIDDLLQFVGNTEMHAVSLSEVTVDAELARKLECKKAHPALHP